ncbi:MAG: class I SAM-dependent methyltransferase [Gammaproteobacteria bacterium]|nr:class I SAM-dependent methyltransferase [Gammaproteobacteria bacterium]
MTAPDQQQHWDAVYGRRSATEVSWYEAEPAQSLAWISATGLAPADPIIDVGGGASLLVDRLLALGHTDVTVLDFSGTVLAQVGARLGTLRRHVTLLEQDIRSFTPTRRYALWHDRAVFHFLTDPADRERYRSALLTGTSPGSHVIIATFGPQGPVRCSGLDTCRYEATSLARELGAPFRLSESLLCEHMTPSGSSQQFLYARFVRIDGP